MPVLTRAEESVRDQRRQAQADGQRGQHQEPYAAGAAGGEPPKPRDVTFTADHPFLYLITEASTGAVLFAGRFGAK